MLVDGVGEKSPTLAMRENAPMGVGLSDIKQIVRNGARFKSPPMFSDKSYKITGITKDSTGAALGNCVVDLFYTLNDVLVGKTESDASGNFTFLVGPSLSCYIVAYKVGSPDVSGTSVNTLIAA